MFSIKKVVIIALHEHTPQEAYPANLHAVSELSSKEAQLAADSLFRVVAGGDILRARRLKTELAIFGHTSVCALRTMERVRSDDLTNQQSQRYLITDERGDFVGSGVVIDRVLPRSQKWLAKRRKDYQQTNDMSPNFFAWTIEPGQNQPALLRAYGELALLAAEQAENNGYLGPWTAEAETSPSMIHRAIQEGTSFAPMRTALLEFKDQFGDVPVRSRLYHTRPLKPLDSPPETK